MRLTIRVFGQALIVLALVQTARLVVAAAPLGLPGLVGGDFTAYLTAGRIVDHGGVRRLYDLSLQRRTEMALEAAAGVPSEQRFMLAFDNPPPAALLFAPLATLPPAPALAVWTGVNVACAMVAFGLLSRTAPLGRREAGSLALASLLFWPALLGFFYGQMMGLVLLLFTLVVLGLRDGRTIQAGLALTALAAIKPQYAALLALVALLQWRGRTLLSAAVSGLALAALSLGMVGWNGLLAYQRELGALDPYAGNSAYLIDPQVMINWRALLLHIAPGLTPAVGFLLTNALGLVTAGLAVAIWVRVERRGGDPYRWPLLTITAATLLATYHSHVHGAALLIVPFVLLRDSNRTGVGQVLAALAFWPPVAALALLGPAALALRPLISLGFIAWLVAALALSARTAAQIRLWRNLSLPRLKSQHNTPTTSSPPIIQFADAACSATLAGWKIRPDGD